MEGDSILSWQNVSRSVSTTRERSSTRAAIVNSAIANTLFRSILSSDGTCDILSWDSGGHALAWDMKEVGLLGLPWELSTRIGPSF